MQECDNAGELPSAPNVPQAFLIAPTPRTADSVGQSAREPGVAAADLLVIDTIDLSSHADFDVKRSLARTRAMRPVAESFHEVHIVALTRRAMRIDPHRVDFGTLRLQSKERGRMANPIATLKTSVAP